MSEIEWIYQEPNVEEIKAVVGGLIGWCRQNQSGGNLPEHKMEGVAHYLLYGRPVHRFLHAFIIDAPLSEVLPLADEHNLAALMSWHRLIYNIFPREAWRDVTAYHRWIHQGGLKGERLPALSYLVQYEAVGRGEAAADVG